MIQSFGVIYWSLLTGASLWLSLAFLAPYALVQKSIVGPILYIFFHQVCHQLPDRSFFWFGHPLAVCHRCLGLYLGFWVGLLLYPYVHTLRDHLKQRPRIILIFLLPAVLDSVTLNNPWSRWTTGLLATFPVALFVMISLQQWGQKIK